MKCVDIGECEIKINPCISSSCNKSSFCIPTTSGSFECVCSDEQQCENKYYMSKFDARSFVQRDSLIINNLKIIQLIFLSKKIEGILLYNRIDSTNFIGIKNKTKTTKIPLALWNQTILQIKSKIIFKCS